MSGRDTSRANLAVGCVLLLFPLYGAAGVYVGVHYMCYAYVRSIRVVYVCTDINTYMYGCPALSHFVRKQDFNCKRRPTLLQGAGAPSLIQKQPLGAQRLKASRPVA